MSHSTHRTTPASAWECQERQLWRIGAAFTEVACPAVVGEREGRDRRHGVYRDEQREDAAEERGPESAGEARVYREVIRGERLPFRPSNHDEEDGHEAGRDGRDENGRDEKGDGGLALARGEDRSERLMWHGA